MNHYFLVLDSKNRLVFKKKLDAQELAENLSATLASEYQKQGYTSYLLEGESLKTAMATKNLSLDEDHAFYTKRELKEQFFFTDKRIKTFLGDPDRMTKVKGSSDKFLHLYSKIRVEAVLERPEYQESAQDVKVGREKQTKLEVVLSRGPIANVSVAHGPIVRFPDGRRRPKVSGNSLENLASARLKELLGRLKKDWDLNEYKEFFPIAREMKRKHIFFVGPTNSGKSYRGFNEISNGKSGAYLSPLRLLALEGQEEIEKRGHECSLLTGEEMELKEGATFVSSTIEMANLERPVDSVLIDEAQLILDKNRGWAWSQAIVGLPAEKIIMTGSEECLPTLRRLIEDYLGEELEVIRLDRIGKLELLKKPVGDLAKVEAGSAIITFSRRGVLAFKKELEDAGRKVSVLYGNLSPGVRREEARRFRAGETDVLVATDCIGMGLNLPIKTVIFSETSKYDGKEVRDLGMLEIKQIAGRAGRFGKFECGYVGVTSHASLKLVAREFHGAVEAILEPCVVRPTQTQLEVLRDQIGGSSVKAAISLFSQLSKVKSTIVCSDLTEMITLADRIEMTASLSELSFRDKYLFTCAPVSATDMVIEEYLQWLTSYSKKIPIELQEDKYLSFPKSGSTSEDHVLNHAENCVKVLTLYHWLARKKGEFFPSIEKCAELRENINGFIENSLKKKGLHRKCPECSKKLPVHSMHKVCDECFRSRPRW